MLQIGEFDSQAISTVVDTNLKLVRCSDCTAYIIKQQRQTAELQLLTAACVSCGTKQQCTAGLVSSRSVVQGCMQLL
jgi:hypothetical protein